MNLDLIFMEKVKLHMDFGINVHTTYNLCVNVHRNCKTYCLNYLTNIPYVHTYAQYTHMFKGGNPKIGCQVSSTGKF